MSLKWENYTDLARALDAKHPEIDRVRLSREQIRELAVALDGFDDAPRPDDPELLDAILYAWIGLHDEGDERWEPR